MELKEAVAKLDEMTEQKKKNYCDGTKHEPPQTGKNLIDGLTGTPTPPNLLENMEDDDNSFIPTLPGTKRTGGRDSWDIEQCDPSTFPWQTHHIIPKKFLPTEPVCVWLTKKYTKHPEYRLAADTCYSTDHANNGYCLPFVSTTYQWREAKKGREKDDPKRITAQDKTANDMMEKTQKQLHQGNHNKQDFDEEDDVELEEYLESLRNLLERIYDAGYDHVHECKECKKDGKKKVQPLKKIVDQVDVVSLITKLRIDAREVFVSQRAYDFHKK